MFIGNVYRRMVLRASNFSSSVGDLPVNPGNNPQLVRRFICDHCDQVIDSLDVGSPMLAFECPKCSQLVSIKPLELPEFQVLS
jgi:phage FluMu protein Com